MQPLHIEHGATNAIQLQSCIRPQQCRLAPTDSAAQSAPNMFSGCSLQMKQAELDLSDARRTSGALTGELPGLGDA
jgi:hypothetical protein